MDESNRKGISADYKRTFDNSLTVTASAKLLDAEFSDGELEGNQIPMASETTLTTGVIIPVTNKSRLTVIARYESEKALYDDYGNEEPKLPSFTEYDLAFDHEITPSTQAKITIANLTDKQRLSYGVKGFSSNAYVPNEGRIIRLGLTHRF